MRLSVRGCLTTLGLFGVGLLASILVAIVLTSGLETRRAILDWLGKFLR